MSVNTSTLSSINHIRRNQNALSISINRLSSGLRINSAADDSAGFAISTSFRSEHRSLLQASRNINDGIGVVQTLESAVTAQQNITIRMREIFVQAHNETYGGDDREQMRTELVELRREYDRIGTSTQFNGKNLLWGTAISSSSVKLQIGTTDVSDYQLTIDLTSFHSDNDIKGLGNISRSGGIGFSDSTGTDNLDPYSDALFETEKTNALTNLDSLINTLSNRKSELGAFQNRLESALNNNRTYEQNLLSTTSAITDVDYAIEASNLARHQVMMNASVSALTQAKGISTSVLSLL